MCFLSKLHSTPSKNQPVLPLLSKLQTKATNQRGALKLSKKINSTKKEIWTHKLEKWTGKRRLLIIFFQQTCETLKNDRPKKEAFKKWDLLLATPLNWLDLCWGEVLWWNLEVWWGFGQRSIRCKWWNFERGLKVGLISKMFGVNYYMCVMKCFLGFKKCADFVF